MHGRRTSVIDKEPIVISACISATQQFHWVGSPIFLTVTLFLAHASLSFQRALVDSGASVHTLIHEKHVPRICQLLQIQPINLPKPRLVQTFEGLQAQPITQAIYPNMRVKEHAELSAPMLITNLGHHDMILGQPWMKEHGVLVDAANEDIIFRNGFCKHWGAPARSDGPDLQIPPVKPDPSRMKESELLDQAGRPPLLPPTPPPTPPPRKARVLQHQEKILKDLSKMSIPSTPGCPTPPPSPPKTPPRRIKRFANENHENFTINEIGAWAFANLASKSRQARYHQRKNHQPDKVNEVGWLTYDMVMEALEVNSMEPTQIATTVVQQEDEGYTPPPLPEIQKLLPEEYHDFCDVFDKSKAERLPPHRVYDHKLELTGSLPVQRKLYPMSGYKLQKVKEYLEDNLAKGFITPSQASFASPILFVQKSNGDLRFCVDYRKLNEITKRNRYPLPLMDEVLARVQGCRYMTRLDVIAAFNKLRMDEGSEDYTTFATSLGAYKYRVLPFGLTNGPASFQQYMNDVLFEYLNDFAQAYMDDILIYSKSFKEHRHHVRSVFQKLRDAGLQVDIHKCEFHVQKTKFLGLIVTTEGLEMDPAKIEAVKTWKPPTHLKGVQAFVGFCNFYRRFIKDFSKIVKPLTQLSHRQAPFEWSSTCNAAFELLKQAMQEAPVLRHYNPDKEAILEADASDYVTGGILSQYDDEGILHPVAYYSKKMLPAECNYHIYDKELLAIIRCLEAWRPELEATAIPVKVFTDHKGLEYFMQAQKLTRRQARYLETLSEFNFKIVYRSGKQNEKADALTRMADAKPTSDQDDRVRHQYQTILTPDRLQINSAASPPSSVAATKGSTASAPAEPAPAITAGDDSNSAVIPIYERVREANRTDEFLDKVREALKEKKETVEGIGLKHYSTRDGVVYNASNLFVPQSMVTELIREVHEQPSSNHPGRDRLIELLRRDYHWIGMRPAVERFVANCHTCLRVKPSKQKPNGLLRPVAIPQRKWTDLSMDFITGLPDSEGFNAILTVVDRLTKGRHYIPCKWGEGGTSAEETAWLMIREVFAAHGLPLSIISDRGSQFVSYLWQALCKRLGITSKLSTAYHPQTDGQSERANQDIERGLRAYCNYHQDNWVKLLPMLQFADNNVLSSATQMTPFFFDHGYHPRMSFTNDDTPYETTRQRILAGQAHQIADTMEHNLRVAQQNIAKAQETMTKQANRHRREEFIEIGDLVMLNRTNLKSDRPSLKLDDKQFGPFKVIGKKDSNYRLELPATMMINNNFHASLLHKLDKEPLPGQINPPPPPIIVEDHEEYEVVEILNSRTWHGHLEYQVHWSNWPKDLTWYRADGGQFEHSQEVVDAYHQTYPERPGPEHLAPRRRPKTKPTPVDPPGASAPMKRGPGRPPKARLALPPLSPAPNASSTPGGRRRSNRLKSAGESTD